ncbi:MAG: hypothetical protein ACOZDY_15000 [Pseudomonadota bacterium]
MPETLRLRCNGWLEEKVMGAPRSQLVGRLRAADHPGRLRLHYPVVPDIGIDCVNVHAKLMISATPSAERPESLP